MNKKERRHSGRVTPASTLKVPYAELAQEGLEPQVFYDDWEDYRDGMRCCKDKTKIKSVSWHNNSPQY